METFKTSDSSSTYWFYDPQLHQNSEQPAEGRWTEMTKELVWRRSFPRAVRGSNTDSVGLLFWKFCRFYSTEFEWSARVVDPKQLGPRFKTDTSNRKPGLIVACPVELHRYLVVQDANLERVLSKMAEVFFSPAEDKLP